MITAHLPSGVVYACALPRTARALPWVVPAALIGAVFPDLDLIWFYFIDDRAFHHHKYLVHAPAFWLGVALIATPILKLIRPDYLPAALAFLGAVFLHICLDSIAGDIMWLWPFSDQLYALITVPPTQSHWILSFIFHPVMLLEIAIWIMAAVLLWSRR